MLKFEAKKAEKPRKFNLLKLLYSALYIGYFPVAPKSYHPSQKNYGMPKIEHINIKYISPLKYKSTIKKSRKDNKIKKKFNPQYNLDDRFKRRKGFRSKGYYNSSRKSRRTSSKPILNNKGKSLDSIVHEEQTTIYTPKSKGDRRYNRIYYLKAA
jgi:hypothetical protein